MKKLLTILVVLTVSSYVAKSQVLQQIQGMDFEYYKRKPLNTIIAALPAGYTISEIGPLDNLKKASIIDIVYPNHVFVRLWVHTFQFMDPYAPMNTWDIVQFRKENLFMALLYDQTGNCIKGCDDVE